jgi:TRAP-type C4-dicarboxylate transport system, large permease component
MPFIILGGIYGGICTPTEAAVLAVAYGFLVGTFVYRELRPKIYIDLLVDAVVGTALIMIIISFCGVFSTFLAGNRIPQLVAAQILLLTDNPLVIMLLINIMLLVVGTFMDLAPAVVILVPILIPLAEKMNYDPIHFGIIVTTNLLIGLVTPPVGICLFMGARISGSKMDAVIKELGPLFITMILVLVLVNFFPSLSLALLHLTGSR